MGVFRYKAIPVAGGRAVSGEIEAENARQARAQLREKGLLPSQLDQKTEAGETQRDARLRLSSSQLNTLTRQFSALLSAGLTIDEALFILGEQSELEKEKRLMQALRTQIAQGAALSLAMSRFPRVFPSFYRILVRAGEESGRLPTVMQRLADYLEARGELASKVGLAFIYPAVVLVVSLAVVAGMITWVVPQMIQVFQSSKQTLPVLTRIMLWLSDFLTNWGGWMLLAIGIGVAVFLRALKNPDFRYRVHAWRLRLPLFGRFDHAANTARFASTLSILVGGGVPLLSAMQAAEGVMTSLPMQRAVDAIAHQVREGVTLSRALSAIGGFPPVLVHLVSSGEATGRLEQMLDRAATEQSKDLARRIETFTSLLGPIVVLLMGAVVLMIVLAILLPVFEMNQLVK
jgi:general secretion pathway protein F